jgi:hypothetical protein
MKNPNLRGRLGYKNEFALTSGDLPSKAVLTFVAQSDIAFWQVSWLSLR